MMLVLAIVEIFSVILQRIFCDSTLKKKKIRRYTDYLVWGGYFVYLIVCIPANFLYRLSGMGRIFCGLQRCYICFNVSGRWHE